MAQNQTLNMDFSKSLHQETGKNEIFFELPTQQSKQILKDKQYDLNKTTIPIKQYSNKFLRTSKNQPKVQLPCKKFNTQQRFNLILKKKNALSKNIFKENTSRLQDYLEPKQQRTAMLKVSSVCKPRKQNHVKTEASFTKQNCEGYLSRMDFLQASFYNLLSVPSSNIILNKSRFFQENRREHKNKRNRSISIQELDKKDKISQSRGLELFSKIFVRSKDQMLQKKKKKSLHIKQNSKYIENQQNFQTRKITPIQKNRKAKIFVDSFRAKKQSIKKYHTIDNCEQIDEVYELSGWDTIT